MMSKAFAKVKKWWKFYNLSADERWLSESSNIAELEHRLRKLHRSNDRMI